MLLADAGHSKGIEFPVVGRIQEALSKNLMTGVTRTIRHLARITLREGADMLIFDMRDLMLFTKMPTPRMHHVQNIKKHQ